MFFYHLGCKGFTTSGLQILASIKDLHKLEVTNVKNSRESKACLSKIMPDCSFLD